MFSQTSSCLQPQPFMNFARRIRSYEMEPQAFSSKMVFKK